VRDRDTKGKSSGRRSEHFVAVRDEQQDVRANARERIRQSESCKADGLRHAHIGIGIEQTFDDGDSLGRNF
jgi:hypothetical protein